MIDQVQRLCKLRSALRRRLARALIPPMDSKGWAVMLRMISIALTWEGDEAKMTHMGIALILHRDQYFDASMALKDRDVLKARQLSTLCEACFFLEEDGHGVIDRPYQVEGW
jgi:hypothetical protein